MFKSSSLSAAWGAPMMRFLVQETADGNCPAGQWKDYVTGSWEEACWAVTGIPAMLWRRTSDPFGDLRNNRRLCRVQGCCEKCGSWEQRWYSAPTFERRPA